MKTTVLTLTLGLSLASSALVASAEPPAKSESAPPDRKGGPGGPSQESPEMQELLKSFNFTPEQKAKYEAAKTEVGKKMREIHQGKVSGSLPQEEVLKQALAAHKAFNAAVKEILTPDQYAKWEPLREADHHKIAEAHKARDAAEQK